MDFCLLQRYWERLKMVTRMGGYYGAPFCEERGVTQGDPLLPTIFNVVVDTVVCHWESLVVEREGGDSSRDVGDGEPTAERKIRGKDDGRQQAEEGHQRLTVKAVIFYADDGMVTSTDPGWVQLAFDMLTGMFYPVGLRTNV